MDDKNAFLVRLGSVGGDKVFSDVVIIRKTSRDMYGHGPNFQLFPARRREAGTCV